MNNYQASVYYSSLPIYNAENYAKSGQGSVRKLVADIETYEFADCGDAPLYFGFDGQTETLDIELDGSVVTKTYYDWYQALYYGEYAIADAEVKNRIMAAMELNLLRMYRDCPLFSPSTAQLYSMKINYPTYTEVFEVGFGGIRRMTYNFTDAEWEAFCAENNNQLNYN